MSVMSIYAKFGASCTKIDRGRHERCKIWNEMCYALNGYAVLMLFIVGIIMFMTWLHITVGRMEGDLHHLSEVCSL